MRDFCGCKSRRLGLWTYFSNVLVSEKCGMILVSGKCGTILVSGKVGEILVSGNCEMLLVSGKCGMILVSSRTENKMPDLGLVLESLVLKPKYHEKSRNHECLCLCLSGWVYQGLGLSGSRSLVFREMWIGLGLWLETKSHLSGFGPSDRLPHVRHWTGEACIPVLNP